jgi:hypothetical protein
MPRWVKVLSLAMLLVAIGVVAYFGVRAYLRSRQMPFGAPCAMTAGVDSESETYEGCNGGLCIREVDDDSYCSQECNCDQDCPVQYVCEPTRSRKRRACMHEGVEVTPVFSGPEDAAPPRAYRRKRAP